MEALQPVSLLLERSQIEVRTVYAPRRPRRLFRDAID
jgi:hypothetical protein